MGMTGAVIDREDIGGVLYGRDVDAIVVRRPDGAGLRLKRDVLGVGNAVAELDGFAAADGAGAGVEHLDGEVFAAELFDGDAVLFALFFGALDGGALLDGAIFSPARENDPTYIEEDDADDQ